MSTLLLTNMENTYGVILALSLYPNPNKLHATLFLKYKISKEKLFSLSASYCRSTTLSDTRRRIYIEQKIWGCLLRWFKKRLNNITRIFIHFYGHTYIQKMQTEISSPHHQTAAGVSARQFSVHARKSRLIMILHSRRCDIKVTLLDKLAWNNTKSNPDIWMH